jgi:hypothetical protein
MAVNFPPSPTNNQVFTSGGISWVYSTAIGAWKILPNTIQGTQGIQGIQGTSVQGTSGTSQGIQGLQGLQGTGVQGASGTSQGIQGIQGLSIQGIQGIQGLSVQGLQGPAAPSTTLTATDDTTTTALYPVMVGAAGSAQTPKVTTTKLTFNASTGALTSSTAAKSSADTTLATTGFVKAMFYTAGTGGVLDWNDSTNLNPGTGTTLLLGSATNGPGGGNYYHPVNFSYSDLGTGGNITQLAVSYASPANELYMRGRYNGTWSTSWVRFLNSSNYNSFSPTLTGGGASGTWGINTTGWSNYSYNLTQGFNSNAAGGWNTDFTEAPAGSMISRGDTSTGSAAGGPGGGTNWWFQQNFRHANGTGYWGVQIAWGWEDNAHRLLTRNWQNGTASSWIEYINTNNSRSHIGSFATGEVGTYGLFVISTNTVAQPGSTILGSSLRYTNATAGGTASPSTPAGTWRCMGYSNGSSTVPEGRTTVFLRIS